MRWKDYFCNFSPRYRNRVIWFSPCNRNRRKKRKMWP